MWIRTPIALSALVVAGLVTAGSSASQAFGSPDRHEPVQPSRTTVSEQSTSASLPKTVGLLPAAAKPYRVVRAASPMVSQTAAEPLLGRARAGDVALPSTSGVIGIPQIVLAAYRNAELALASTEPNCGLSWNLLAGIGRIESGHARSGRTDAEGTTVEPIPRSGARRLIARQ